MMLETAPVVAGRIAALQYDIVLKRDLSEDCALDWKQLREQLQGVCALLFTEPILHWIAAKSYAHVRGSGTVDIELTCKERSIYQLVVARRCVTVGIAARL